MTDNDINRQKAEIERLTVDNLIKSQGRPSALEIVYAYERGRAEAITEFETKLTMHFGTYTDKDYLRVIDVVRLIDQTAKELKEGVNNA